MRDSATNDTRGDRAGPPALTVRDAGGRTATITLAELRAFIGALKVCYNGGAGDALTPPALNTNTLCRRVSCQKEV